MALDSTDLTNLDSEITTAISNGTITVREVIDAAGNKMGYQNILDLIKARKELAALTTKNARTSSFDKFKFETKS